MARISEYNLYNLVVAQRIDKDPGNIQLLRYFIRHFSPSEDDLVKIIAAAKKVSSYDKDSFVRTYHLTEVIEHWTKWLEETKQSPSLEDLLDGIKWYRENWWKIYKNYGPETDWWEIYSQAEVSLGELSATVLDWRKAPSVTTGGKPYFWVGYAGGQLLYWVVWDRYERKWAVTDANKVLAYFDSAAAGKKWAQSH